MIRGTCHHAFVVGGRLRTGREMIGGGLGRRNRNGYGEVRDVRPEKVAIYPSGERSDGWNETARGMRYYIRSSYGIDSLKREVVEESLSMLHKTRDMETPLTPLTAVATTPMFRVNCRQHLIYVPVIEATGIRI